jgi:hypothetical protein
LIVDFLNLIADADAAMTMSMIITTTTIVNNCVAARESAPR